MDTRYGVVRGDLGGVVGTLAANQRARKGRGVNISRAVTAVGEHIVLVISVFAALVNHHARFSFFIGNTREDYVFTSQSQELSDDFLHVGSVIFGLVFGIGQEASLGHVGNHVIRLGAQPLHCLHKGAVKAGVELSVVCHGGVDDRQAAFLAAGGDDLGNIIDLLGASQISRVNSVKADSLLLPMTADRGHILSQIAEGIARKARGMGGKHGGGKDAGLHAASGENGKGNGQRALTDTGNILNGE